VVCGNQRLLAAVELGWTKIPAVVVELDAEAARLWMLRDNNAYGEWEEDVLGELGADRLLGAGVVGVVAFGVDARRSGCGAAAPGG
jgi:hypothetical protein